MGPPRLTVVETAGQPRKAEEPYAGGDGMAANDAAPVGGEAPSGSPVHDLITAIEERAAPSVPEADPERREKIRILEAVIFAASEPQDEARLATYLKAGDDVGALLAELQASYAGRGVSLTRVAGKWAFRTADDLSWVLERHARQERRLSRAALETLAIVAYHQPVTRAEIEEIRGVTISKGTLDSLIEMGWVRLRGRRKVPGRPVTYGTTEQFLVHFGLDQVSDLPGLEELKGAGFLDDRLPAGFSVPMPNDVSTLREDEDPLEDGDPELDPDSTK